MFCRSRKRGYDISESQLPKAKEDLDGNENIGHFMNPIASLEDPDPAASEVVFFDPPPPDYNTLDESDGADHDVKEDLGNVDEEENVGDTHL